VVFPGTPPPPTTVSAALARPNPVVQYHVALGTFPRWLVKVSLLLYNVSGQNRTLHVEYREERQLSEARNVTI
jgi:hypothetical protein